MDVLQNYIDVQVVAFCLLFGNVIKNTKNINNNSIPFLLMIIGAVISIFIRGLAPENLLIGIYSAWISTGIHSTQSGVRKLYREER